MPPNTSPNHEPAETPNTPEPIADQPTESGKPPVSRSKKSAVTFVAVIGILALLLLLLKLIPFDRLAEEITEEPPTTVVTYDEAYFDTPVYDEDFTADSEYTDLNRFLYYTSLSGETFEVNGDAGEYGEVCRLFETFRTAVIAGDSDTYNSLFTDDYIKENGALSFAPQKLYNFRVKELSSEYLKDGDANGLYQGATVTYCQVNYCIKDNNGTFRNDFYREGDSRTQIFEILDYKGSVKISQISTPTYVTSDNTQEKEGFSIMFFIWIAAIILAVVVEALTTELVAIWFLPGGIVSMILALCDVDLSVQLIVYFASALVLIILFRLLYKKFGKPKQHIPTNADRIIGGIGNVTEEINNLTPSGEVKIDGKRWTARTEKKGEIIEVGAHVKVLRIEGVKLICTRFTED